jgi:hypothetical protein
MLYPTDAENRQIHALAEALANGGFTPRVDFQHGLIRVQTLPEFHGKLIFDLTISMDDPLAEEWRTLFDGCALESGRILAGATHGAGIYSRKKAVERAKQEKWAALWSLYDAGIIPEEQKPGEGRWQDIVLP